LPALAEIEDLDSLNVEMGFSEPGAAPDAEGGPELTVVGGTEHTPVLSSVAAADIAGPPESQVGDSRTPPAADASAAMPQAEGDTGADPDADASAAAPQAEGDTAADPDAEPTAPSSRD